MIVVNDCEGVVCWDEETAILKANRLASRDAIDSIVVHRMVGDAILFQLHRLAPKPQDKET